MKHVIRSEWTKLRSVRSTSIAMLATVFSGVVLGVVGASDMFGTSAVDAPSDWDPTAAGLKGFLMAQLIIAMLGALSVTPEFDSGMIGTSLGVVPSRSRLLAAKTIVVAGLAAATAVATTVLSFTVVQVALGATGAPRADLGDPGVVRALAGGMTYLTLVALIGVAIGALTRSTTRSLAAIVAALLLVPALAPGLPGAIGDAFERCWPFSAGQAAYEVVPGEHTVSPTAGLLILAASAIVVGAASHAHLRRRDV